MSVSAVLWICQALSPPKQRYSLALVDGRRPLPGDRRLKCSRSAGHIYPSFAEGNANIFVIPWCQVQGAGAGGLK